MWLLWMLWVLLAGGGLFMGLGATWTVYRQGFDLALGLEAVLYLGIAGYSLPRLWKLVAGTLVAERS